MPEDADHVYLEEFADWEGVRGSFALPADAPEPDKIFAVYDTPAYEGYANVVFQQDGVWQQASGSHCSCYGLEGQWEPEPFDPALQLAAMKEGKSTISFGYHSEGKRKTQFALWLAAQIGGGK